MNKILFFLAINLIFGGVHASAKSGQESGGGTAVVCYEGDKIISAELLDLFEERVVFGKNLIRYPGSVEQQLQRVYNKLPEIGSRFDLEERVRQVQRILRELPSDINLTPIDDVDPIAFPKNCKIEQLAAQHFPDFILLDQKIWRVLSNTDRAALILHEAIYSFEIELARSSRHVRKTVGALFSEEGQFPSHKPKVSEALYGCSAWTEENGGADATYFTVHRKESEDGPWYNPVVLKFSKLFGLPVYSYTDVQFHPAALDIENDLIRRKWNFENKSLRGQTFSLIAPGNIIQLVFIKRPSLKNPGQMENVILFSGKSVWNGIEVKSAELKCGGVG